MDSCNFEISFAAGAFRSDDRMLAAHSVRTEILHPPILFSGRVPTLLGVDRRLMTDEPAQEVHAAPAAIRSSSFFRWRLAPSGKWLFRYVSRSLSDIADHFVDRKIASLRFCSLVFGTA